VVVAVVDVALYVVDLESPVVVEVLLVVVVIG
jgi:hypothetical protein